MGLTLGFPGSSAGKRKKICLQCRRPQFDSWVKKIPWRRDRLPTPVFLGFLGGSDSEESTYSVGDLFNPWVGKIPWRRAWQPIPIFLPGESPWTEKPGGLQSMGWQRVRHDWAIKHSTGAYFGESQWAVGKRFHSKTAHAKSHMLQDLGQMQSFERSLLVRPTCWFWTASRRGRRQLELTLGTQVLEAAIFESSCHPKDAGGKSKVSRHPNLTPKAARKRTNRTQSSWKERNNTDCCCYLVLKLCPTLLQLRGL